MVLRSGMSMMKIAFVSHFGRDRAEIMMADLVDAAAKIGQQPTEPTQSTVRLPRDGGMTN